MFKKLLVMLLPCFSVLRATAVVGVLETGVVFDSVIEQYCTHDILGHGVYFSHKNH